MTELTRRKVRTDLRHQPPVPECLVLQLPDEFPPASVTDAQRQGAVLHHVARLEMLRADDLVFTHQGGGELLGEVLAPVDDACVNPGEFGFRSPVSRTASPAPGQPSLCFAEFPQGGTVVPGILYMTELLAVGHHRERLQADVHTHRKFWRGREVGDLHLAQDARFIVPLMNAANRDVQDLPLNVLLTFRLDPPELRELQPPVFHLDVAVRELRAVGPTRALLLEVWESRSPACRHRAEEVLVGLFKVAKGLLQRELVDLREPGRVLCFFEGRQAFVGLVVRHSASRFPVRGHAQREVMVVDEPGAADRLVDQLTLSGVRVEPDLEGLFPEGDRGRFHAQHLLGCSVPATLPAARTAWGHCLFNLSQNQSISFVSP